MHKHPGGRGGSRSKELPMLQRLAYLVSTASEIGTTMK